MTDKDKAGDPPPDDLVDKIKEKLHKEWDKKKGDKK